MDGLASRTVLIVEDEWLVRMELASAFEDEGCAVLESGTAEDAVSRLHDSVGIDLLVTDIRLGGPLTGWEVAIEARARDPRIAVIYVSANPPVPNRSVSGGVFIDKPAMLEEVIATARHLLAG